MPKKTTKPEPTTDDFTMRRATVDAVGIFAKQTKDFYTETKNWFDFLNKTWSDTDRRTNETTIGASAIRVCLYEVLSDHQALEQPAQRLKDLKEKAYYTFDFLALAEILAEASRIFQEARQTYDHAHRSSALGHGILHDNN